MIRVRNESCESESCNICMIRTLTNEVFLISDPISDLLSEIGIPTLGRDNVEYKRQLIPTLGREEPLGTA